MEKENMIIKKLDTIIALLATQGQSDEIKIKVLRNLNLTYSEISKLTGIPEGTLKTRDRKKRKSK